MILLGSLGAGSITATGGTVTTIVVNGISYKLHTFTSGDTFSISSGADNVDYLIVGGGGSGGSGWGNNTNVYRGGSAGTVNQGTLFKGEGSYSVTVGNGGGSVTTTSTGTKNANGNSGVSSSVFSVTSNGGAGGTGPNATLGGDGAGANATSRLGGVGLDISSFLGQSAGTTYIGGGGGATSENDYNGNYTGQSVGGGGSSRFGATPSTGVNGNVNTGSGGGASWYSFTGGSTSGAGGSGVVYIKYQI
jgi:hypothetical protein